MSLDDRLRAALAEDAAPALDPLFRLTVVRAAAARRAKRALFARVALITGAGLALIGVAPQLAALGEPLAIAALACASLWAARQFARAAR